MSIRSYGHGEQREALGSHDVPPGRLKVQGLGFRVISFKGLGFGTTVRSKDSHYGHNYAMDLTNAYNANVTTTKGFRL